jgi:hypothetical protein
MGIIISLSFKDKLSSNSSSGIIISGTVVCSGGCEDEDEDEEDEDEVRAVSFEVIISRSYILYIVHFHVHIFRKWPRR